MKSTRLVKTLSGNRYFYDQKMKRIHLCHPLLYYMLSLSQEGTEVRAWLDSLEDHPAGIEIPGCGHFSKQEILYYFQKYLLLKENGYFTEIDQVERMKGEINAETLEQVLANTSQVTFEVTDRCNLSCAYCGYGEFYNDYDKRENKNLDVRSAKRLLAFLRDYWNSPRNRSHHRNIYISFYGGEPLLNFPFIREVVRYVEGLKLSHHRFSFAMTTNGILLHRYMDFLHDHHFNLLISLDGDEQNTAYRVFKTGKPAYADIMENVAVLQERYPDYFRRRVNFNAVLHNKNSVSEIYHFFKTRFNKKPTIGELNTSGIKESQKKKFRETYANLNESLYQSEDYSLIENDMFVQLPGMQQIMIFLQQRTDCCFNDYNDLLYTRREPRRLPTGTCLPFSKKIFVTVKGKILPCERIGQQFGLGQVTAERVELDLEGIAEKYNRYYQKMRPLCQACYHAETCKQCIFNLSTLENEHPVCHGFMTEKEYRRYLSSLVAQVEAKPAMYEKMLKTVTVE
jgi:uncharacterized protein